MKEKFERLKEKELILIWNNILNWYSSWMLSLNSKLFEIRDEIEKEYDIEHFSIKAVENMALHEIIKRYIKKQKKIIN